MSQPYIFIGGVERSGTTLLAKLLVENGYGVSGPETIFKEKWIAKRDFSKVKNHWRFRKIWGVDAGDLTQMSISDGFRRLFLRYNKLSLDLVVPLIDHTPHNVRIASKLVNEFENAVFIHIVRDPRAVYNSFKTLDWGPKTALRSGYYWKKTILLSNLELKASKAKYITIRYENLLEDSASVINQIASELRLEKLKDTDFSFTVPNYTKKQHSLVNKPIDKNRADTANLISENEAEIIQRICAPIMNRYNYVTDPCLEPYVKNFYNFSYFILVIHSLFLEISLWPSNKFRNYLRRFSYL